MFKVYQVVVFVFSYRHESDRLQRAAQFSCGQVSIKPAADNASSSALATLGVAEMDPLHYQRVQRVRSKKATEWIERPLTLQSLTIAAFFLAPLEKVMWGPLLNF